MTQDKFIWPDGQQCAVSLTYDDALPVHYEMVGPLLSSKNITGTFNISAGPNFTEHTKAWTELAAQGHELGNHTLFHPCRREPEERYQWLSPHYDLCNYTSQHWADEMRIANCLLNFVDGQKERTFGNTCCNTTIGTGKKKKSLSEQIDQMFVAGRGACISEIVQPANLCYPELNHFNGDGRTSEDIQLDIERAAEINGWIIFMFHGVGEGTHNGFIETDEHAQLIDFLAENSDRIWTASMVNVANHLKNAGYESQGKPK